VVTFIGYAHGRHSTFEDGKETFVEFYHGCELPVFKYEPEKVQDIYQEYG
jgi:hypothetical protein